MGIFNRYFLPFGKEGVVRKAATELSRPITRAVKSTTDSIDLLKGNFQKAIDAPKQRRLQPYSVAPDVDMRAFQKRFGVFRTQVQLYQIGFFGFGGYCVATASMNPIHLLAALWCAGWYVSYIRDIHRARVVLKNWELRNKPLPLTWKVFFKNVLKKPSILVPFA